MREHDYETFCAAELAARATLGLPPFRRLVQTLCASEDSEAARRAAEALAKISDDAAHGAEDYTRMVRRRPLAKLRGNSAGNCGRGPRSDAAQLRVALPKRRDAAKRACQASVDVDPQSML